MISLNFDIFFRTFDDLVAELKINKLSICCQGKTRAASISAKYTVKSLAWHTGNFAGSQTSTPFDKETVRKRSLAD